MNKKNILLVALFILIGVLGITISKVLTNNISYASQNEFTIKKTDEEGNKLENVEFDIYGKPTLETRPLTTATFDTGENFIIKIKVLAGNENAEIKTGDINIQAFKKASNLPNNFEINDDNTVSSNESESPIYAWYDNGEIYYYTDADKVYLNENSSWMFNRLYNMTDISGLENVITANTKTMDRMFQNCRELTNITPLANWDTSSVINMKFMFGDGEKQPMKLNDITPLTNWDVSKVEDMNQMFKLTSIENLDALANWDVSKVEDMGQMFNNCYLLNDLNGLKNWNVSSVTTMSRLFAMQGATENGLKNSLSDITPLSNWDTSNVTNMNGIFGYCSNLTDISPLTNWDTGNVTNMTDIFSYITNLTDISPLTNWDTKNVTNMSYMFQYTNIINVDALSNWDTRNVTNMQSMFRYTNITNIDALSNWDTKNVTTMIEMFHNCPKITGTFTIKGNPTSYDSMFKDAATEEGSSVTVNYSVNTTNIDNIIATKSENSNVVKGIQID